MTPLLRPLLARAVLRALPDEVRSMPGDEPVVHAAGPDPDRVLLVGSGPVSGAGVHHHRDALPGSVARALTALTGRGAVVEALGRRRVRLEDLAGVVRGARLERFDALVVVVGLFDAIEGASTRPWSRLLHRRLDDLQRDGARDAAILLTSMPLLSSLTPRRGPAVAMADHAVRRLNRAVVDEAAGRPATGCAVLPAPSPATPLATSAWYEACGEALAGALVPLLDAQRDG